MVLDCCCCCCWSLNQGVMMFGDALVARIASLYGQASDDQASVMRCEVLSDCSQWHGKLAEASDSQT